jgi:hypothetical protein
MKTHKHHITPKHAGGSDDPSNIIELTIEEHAEAHRKLFEEHGRWQDEIAWKSLSGQISLSEASEAALLKGRSNGGKLIGKRNADSGHMQNIQKMGCINGIGGKVQGEIETKCPHCGTISNGIVMRRWHGDNCKHKNGIIESIIKVESLAGSKNGRAKPVTVNGITYGCIKDAMEATGLTRSKILKDGTLVEA